MAWPAPLHAPGDEPQSLLQISSHPQVHLPMPNPYQYFAPTSVWDLNVPCPRVPNSVSVHEQATVVYRQRRMGTLYIPPDIRLPKLPPRQVDWILEARRVVVEGGLITIRWDISGQGGFLGPLVHQLGAQDRDSGSVQAAVRRREGHRSLGSHRRRTWPMRMPSVSPLRPQPEHH